MNFKSFARSYYSHVQKERKLEHDELIMCKKRAKLNMINIAMYLKCAFRAHMVRDMYMKTPFYVHMQACNVLKKENWLSYEALLQYPTVADHATVGENNGKELNRK